MERVDLQGLQSDNSSPDLPPSEAIEIPLPAFIDSPASINAEPANHYVRITLSSPKAKTAFQPLVGFIDGAWIAHRGGGHIELTYQINLPAPQPLEGDGWSIEPGDPPLPQKRLRTLSIHQLGQIIGVLQQLQPPPANSIVPIPSQTSNQSEEPPCTNLPLLDKDESIEDMRQFVQLLHLGLPGITEFRLIHAVLPPIVLWAHVDSPVELQRTLEEVYDHNQQGYNAYVGIATRRERKESGGGGKEDVLCTRVLWADLDGVIRLQNPDLLIVPPSLINQSGGGLHLYWLLEYPIEANGELEIALDALAWSLGGDPRVAEAARIMRLPGTINHKPGRKGAECKVIFRSSADHIYPISRFDQLKIDYAPVRIWPKLFANAMHIDMELVCRLWFYVQHLDTAEYNGQGWIPFNARLIAEVLDVNERTIRNWVRQDIQNGQIFFRHYDAKKKRLYLRGQVEVAARLAELALVNEAFDPEIIQDRPVEIPFLLLKGGGKSPNWEAFCAAAFNGWIGLYEARQYRIIWDLIKRTWKRSRPQIESWIDAAGIQREHNIAMLPLPHKIASDHPDFEAILDAPTGPSGPEWTSGINQTGHHWYGVVNNIRCKFWQRGNTYLANQLLLRFPDARGKAEKMRRAAEKAVEREASTDSEQARDNAGLRPDNGASLAGHCSDEADADDSRLRTNFKEAEEFANQRVSHPDLPLYLSQPRFNGSFRHGSPIRVQRFSPNEAFDRQTNWQTELVEGRVHPAKKRKIQRNTAAAVLQNLAREKAA